MSQQGQGGKELLFAIAVPTEQQQFHKGTFLCKTPCLKALRTQEKVSFIGSEPQQQETVTAALVPLPVMSCQVLHSPVQHTCWMAHGKRLPFHSHLLNSCYFQSFSGHCVGLNCLPHTVLWAFKCELPAVSPLNTNSCPASCCWVPSTAHAGGLVSGSIITAQQAAPSSRNLARITLISLSQHNSRKQQKFCLVSR